MPHKKRDDPEWKPVYTPFDEDLYDVVHAADGPYAVGASGSIVANRGEGWEMLVEEGPAARNSTLKTMAVTDDGNRIYFAGASGAFGAYDVKEQKKYDYSYTGDITTSWKAVAVTGKAGKEYGLLANGSGAIVEFRANGHDVKFGEPTKPGGGSAISTMEFAPDGLAYAVDSTGLAYRTKEKRTNKWKPIGVVNEQVSFHDMYAGKEATIYVAASDGRLYRYDKKAKVWTPIGIAETTLRAVDVTKEHIVTLASNNQFYWRAREGEREWKAVDVPTGSDLLSFTLGFPDVAVGKAGTVVNRPPEKPPKPEDPKPPKEKTERIGAFKPCEHLVMELIERLTFEELLHLIEVMECESPLVKEIKKMYEKERRETEENVFVLPLPVEERREERRTERREERRTERRETRRPPQHHHHPHHHHHAPHEHRHERRTERRTEPPREHRHEHRHESRVEKEEVVEKLRRVLDCGC